MASKVPIQAGQTLLDIALQEGGGLQAVFEIAALNGLSITDIVPAGQDVLVSDLPFSSMVRKQYREGGWFPASATTIPGRQVIEPTLEGIGNWAIENDFIVS